jgi:hypothetical protein
MGKDQTPDRPERFQGKCVSARATAHDLIQLHVGPDDRIANVPNFYSALVQTIRAARWQGETDRSREDVLSLV